MAPRTDAALHITDLSFSYGHHRVLDSIGLSVRAGEICGLLGPNGCGKTTLFRCCMGILHPQQGQIFIQGESIAHMPPGRLARRVAYVPQEHGQPFPFTAWEMVLMGRTPHMSGWFRMNARNRLEAMEAMERIGIMSLAHVPFSQLSGGQRQLVLIARAMAQKAPVMILDEPTSALDFSNQLAVWQTLREVAAQGVAILVCCHDPNHILWFCDRAAVMAHGRIIAEGSVCETVTQEGLDRLYGGQCLRVDSPDAGIVVRPAYGAAQKNRVHPAEKP